MKPCTAQHKNSNKINSLRKLTQYSFSPLFLSLLSITSFTSLATLLTVTNSANAALTAVTANTIHGTAPKFSNAIETAIEAENDFKYLGLRYNNANYFTESALIAALKANNDFDITTTKPSDLTPKLTKALSSTIALADMNDRDGDLPDKIVEQSLGSVSIDGWFYNNNGTETALNITQLNQSLCDLTIVPYLKISGAITLKTQYGDPISQDYTNVTRKFGLGGGICYIKPNDMNVNIGMTWQGGSTGTPWEAGSPVPHAVLGGGYTADFVPTKGFKANPTISTRKFPTTGFNRAQFFIVMNSPATDWIFSEEISTGGTAKHGTNIVRVYATGQVLLMEKPTLNGGKIKIRATHRKLSGVYYDYEFNPTAYYWFRPQTGSYTAAQAIAKCNSLGLPVASRAELTNVPNKAANYPTWADHGEVFTRAIGYGVTGEWGYMHAGSYPSSGWVDTDMYITREQYSKPPTPYQYFYMNLAVGSPYVPIFNITSHVACRG